MPQKIPDGMYPGIPDEMLPRIPDALYYNRGTALRVSRRFCPGLLDGILPRKPDGMYSGILHYMLLWISNIILPDRRPLKFLMNSPLGIWTECLLRFQKVFPWDSGWNILYNTIPDEMPPSNPGRMPVRIPDGIPHRFPNEILLGILDGIPKRIPNELLSGIPKGRPLRLETACPKIPDGILPGNPGGLPSQMSYGFPLRFWMECFMKYHTKCTLVYRTKCSMEYQTIYFIYDIKPCKILDRIYHRNQDGMWF